jgi:protein-disulfide isomerase
LLKQYPEAVKVVYKNFPLSSHKFALKAAAAALAAGRQGKFWEYHDELFKNYRYLNDKRLDDIAKELNLNMTKFNQDRQDSSLLKQIDRDLKEGRDIGVRGVPALFINGRRIHSRDLSNLKRLVDEQLEKQNKN